MENLHEYYDLDSKTEFFNLTVRDLFYLGIGTFATLYFTVKGGITKLFKHNKQTRLEKIFGKESL